MARIIVACSERKPDGRSLAGAGERRLGEVGDVEWRPMEPIIDLVSANRLRKNVPLITTIADRSLLR